ncbi:TonB-dependent receptor plug domain-containing protein [Neolewinella antarctica]|uniref:Outer membrane receptor for ferrienterochelin and colicins n=1 Tax=Neolewinella antarctica TaxID=442734 RepID=A0ABX0XCV8_9BACT|nr:TonB-dependent receptor [Neolewinella antarctica]NJC26766.1 outer membrane receptor for ferrienterochelin and colicins [Neolewinella antarctica]
MRLLPILLLITGWLTAQTPDSLVLSVTLDDIVVTGQYAPTEARNAVHKVTVINNREWKEQGLMNLSELLQRQLTMNVSTDPILGNGLSIQGLGGQNVQIMIDGVPVIGRLGGEIDLTQLDLSRFARVEIITGSLSARYGADAAGGVINLITAQEQGGDWKLEAGGQYETIDLDRQYFRLGRKVGDFQVSGGLNRYQARFAEVDSLRAGAVPWNPKDQFGWDVGLRYRPNDSLSIRYEYRRFDETLSLYGAVRRPQFRPYVQDQFFDTGRRDHALSANYRVSPYLTADLVAGLNAFDRLRTTERRDLEPDTTSLVPGEQDTTRYTGQLLRLSLASTTGKKFDAQLGLEYRRETGSGGRILDTATLSKEPILTNAAAWLGLSYRPHADLTVEVTTRFGYNNRYAHPFVPALHLLWKPTPAWRWRASYAAGFRAPSVQELFFNFVDINHFIVGNKELAAEKSTNLRLGGEWGGSGKLPIQVSGEVFYNHLTDRITLADVSDGRFSYVNLAEYETHGVLLQFDYQAGEKITYSGGGALTRLTNAVAVEDSSLPGFTGLFEWRNELTYRMPRAKMTLRVDHRYVGRRDRYQLSPEGSVTQGFIGDYHLLHLTANKAFWGDRIRLSAGVKNLLNRDRVPVTGAGEGGAHSGGTGSQLIDYGRNFFVGIAVGW